MRSPDANPPINRLGAGQGRATIPPPRRRRSSFGRRFGLLFAAMVAVAAFAAPSASAAPWSCDAFGYLFQTPEELKHDVVQVDLATGEFNPDYADSPFHVNAIGYNLHDNFMYGLRHIGTTVTLVRVHSDGSQEEVLPQPGLPEGNYPVGDVDPNGYHWVASPSAAGVPHWWQIDLVPGSPTYGQIVNQGDFGPPPSTLAAPVGSDWAYIDGSFYGIAAGSALSPGPHLVRFTPGSGVEDLGLLPLVASTGAGDAGFGAVYADAAGNLWAGRNSDGWIFRIDPTTGDTVKVTQGPKAGGNDGARCAAAAIPTITVTKTVAGRVVPEDQFTVAIVKPDGSLGDSATTSGSGTTASTVDFPASQGKTYTLTDAMAAGSPTPLSEYVKAIACTDAAGNPVATGGTGPNWTLAVAAATDYTCNVTNKAEADIEIEKSSTARIVPGKPATYELKATNNGPSPATNLVVSDPLPNGVSFVSASNGCSQAAGKVTCNLPSLAVGGSETFTVSVKVDSSAKCSNLENTAVVTSAVFDPNEGNNSSTVRNCERESDLEVKKTASSANVAPGGQVMYTLVVENLGPSDNDNVTVSDALAPGLSLQSAQPSQGSCSTAGGKVSCDLGRLEAEGSAQVLVTATMTASSGCVRNAAEAVGDGFDPDQSNNRDDAEVCPRPQPPSIYELAIKKTANDKRIVADGKVRYTLAVTNKGPDTAPGVRVTDTFNHRATLVSVKATAGSCKKALPVNCSLGNVAAGARVRITVVLKPLESGCKQRNAASVTGEGTDTKPANNLSKVDICVAPKLRVVKEADRKSVKAGGTVRYTIRVTNLSKRIAAQNVRTCDRLSDGLAFLGSVPKAKLSKGMPCWTKAVLKGGKSVVYRVSARALRGSGGAERNVATASAEGSKGKSASDAAVVTVQGQAAEPTPVTG